MINGRGATRRQSICCAATAGLAMSASWRIWCTVPTRCAAGLKITASDLFKRSSRPDGADTPQAGHSVSEMERKLIPDHSGSDQWGNRTHAAKLLGISLRTLRNKLREYRVEEEVTV